MNKITDYTKLLPKGKENAISAADLTTLLGFNDTRALQADIAKSRDAGQIILSSTNGGYFLPANDAEIEEFVAVLRARAIGIFRALSSAKEYLQKDKEQMELNDFMEGLDDEI